MEHLVLFLYSKVLVEETLELLENLLLHRRARLEVVRILHLLERTLLLLVKSFRHINTDIHEQIPRSISIHVRQSLTA